ncbi:uncharacterized protein EAE98_011195 [Botrytis deweyae]|uniref:Amino acid permease/ SLC12A domain-containing protein n=1 Tax=Botrytis deweyae TaxID=2478750 RepID=A0ABQ7I6J5_9HELO|nr:uncharacterized protein EAE98_011195 [Botrytis deweyae]KAF7915329.1 hypothetical protein EAE98_011195 [Botrytis deweyae]
MTPEIQKDGEVIFASRESGGAASNSQDVEKEDFEDEIPGQVAKKWRGTRADQQDMAVLGKKQVLRRNFKFITMLGFASTAMASWELLLPLFTFVMVDGGTADLFWGFIVAACGMSLVYASIAEMASISPTAGGQYHWVSEFAPPRIQRLLSYIVGWLSAIGWQVYLAGVCFMIGGILQGLIALNKADYVYEPFHATLLAIGVVTFSVVFNTSLAERLPLIEGIVLILHLIGFFVIIIPLWVMGPRGDPNTVLLNFTNDGGWSSKGLAAMIGLVSPMSVLIGYDCSVHLSEEIQDASWVVPRAIMWSVGPNATMGFLMAVTLIFTLGDLDAVLETVTGQPFMQVFFNATQSYAATNVMCMVVVILLLSCCISEVAAASRQIWSFARDGGLPGSLWLSQVSPGWNIPLRSVCVSIAVSSLLSLINLGSSVALNAINSLGGVSILCSYFITISCLVWRRLQGPLPPHRWSLGKYGMAINIASLCFLAPITFFSFWPLQTPVTAQNMNWSSVMFVATLSVALIYYYFRARHVYTAPVLAMKRRE